MRAPEQAGDYIYRDVEASDKAEVLAFTAQTWESGDYIDQVFDDWLADPTGRFLAAEARETGRIAAIDKLTMLSPTEAWFEGLRVNPEHRGRGLASRLQRYMIGEATRLGARSIRLITLASNSPIHLACYRDGFRMVCVVRYWKWQDQGTGATAQQAGGEVPYTLRPAAIEEAATLHDQWVRSSAFRTAGLEHLDWSFAATSAARWERAAAEGHLLVKAGAAISSTALPPPTVLLKQNTEEDKPSWRIAAITAVGPEWAPLAMGLVASARVSGIGEIDGLLADTHDTFSGLATAGFTPDSDDARLCLFELSPIPNE